MKGHLMNCAGPFHDRTFQRNWEFGAKATVEFSFCGVRYVRQHCRSVDVTRYTSTHGGIIDLHSICTAITLQHFVEGLLVSRQQPQLVVEFRRLKHDQRHGLWFERDRAEAA